MQYLESWLHRFFQESSVQIYPGEIQHHPTSRTLLLSPPGWLLDCCVRWARCVHRFDDQPGFGARLGLDGPGSLDVPPGLAGLHGVDVRFGVRDFHQHDEPRGFGFPNSLPGLHRAPEVRNCCRWPFGYNTWLWIRDIELIGQTRSAGRGLRWRRLPDWFAGPFRLLQRGYGLLIVRYEVAELEDSRGKAPFRIDVYSLGTQMVGWITVLGRTSGELYELRRFLFPRIKPSATYILRQSVSMAMTFLEPW